MSYDHVFLAPVLLTRGGMTPHKLPLPDAVAEALAEAPTRRMIGTMNGEPFRQALHRSKADGFYFLALSRRTMRALDLAQGDLVGVEMSVDPEPDRVDLGDELAAALDADAEARDVWDSLTTGAKRNVAYTVTSAKRASTDGFALLHLKSRIRAVRVSLSFSAFLSPRV